MQPPDSNMQTWPIERRISPQGLKVARIDTSQGWLMVAPADALLDLDLRMMAGIFISAYDPTLKAHKPGGSSSAPPPIPTGL